MPIVSKHSDQISYDQFCLRICTGTAEGATPDIQCEHELDVMGCAWVMAIPDFYQTNNSFTSCDGDAAIPPGLYPQSNGSTSTFRQRYTGTYTGPSGSTELWTVGQTVTPSAPASYPKSSNCFTYSTISNGVNTADLMVTAAPVLLVSGSSSTVDVASTSGVSTTPVSGAASGAAATSGGASASASRSGSASASGTTSSRSSSQSTGASGTSTNANADESSGAASGRVSVSSPGVVLGAAFGAVGLLVGAVAAL